MKAAGFFVIKCVAFTAIFWSLWTFVFRPISHSVSASGQSGSQSSNDSDKLMEKYWQQAREADRIQAKYFEQAKVTDQQQRKMELVLSKQDAILDRFDRVVRHMESQSSNKK
jgi:hypothetical protein